MNFGALMGSLHRWVWEEQIKRFLAYFFQIFSTLSCDTFSNRRCSGHTLLRIARSCLGGRAANKKTINSRCVKSKLLLSAGFPWNDFRWVKTRKRKVERRTTGSPTNSTECLALLKSPFCGVYLSKSHNVPRDQKNEKRFLANTIFSPWKFAKKKWFSNLG